MAERFDFDSFPVLETPRLVLRELQPDDAQALMAVFGDAEVLRYHDLEPFSSAEQVQQMIERLHAAFAGKQRWRWGIALRDSDQIIGTGGFVSWNRAWALGELGYDLARASWGQGLMTEALRAMIQFGFAHMGLHRIEAEVMPANRASVRVLEKLGFQYEGTLRGRGYWKGAYHDLMVYALVAVS
jgi:ribosomal-protein-alanine N-acetyltransferase